MQENRFLTNAVIAVILVVAIVLSFLIFSAFVLLRQSPNPYVSPSASAKSPSFSSSPQPTTLVSPSNFSPLPSSSVSPPFSTSEPSPIPTPTYPLSNNPTYERFVDYALSLINSDRQKSGLQDVTLSSVSSGQIHADDMLKNGYFSHWDTNGYKPYMRYTLAGGQGSVAENIAWQRETGNVLGINVTSALESMEWGMMYDDASSNWGHKDNILNPLHNKVSIGIAYDDHNVYFVQDFEDAYVIWTERNVSGNQVTLQGSIQKDGLNIQSVTIFYDKPTNLSSVQLENPPYQGGYDPGTYVGMALPQNYQATGAITITADNWSQNGNNFQISFSLSQAIATYGTGVYTFYVETGASTADSLTTFSVWVR